MLSRLLIFESSSGVCLFSRTWPQHWTADLDAARSRVCALVQFFFQLSREIDDGGQYPHQEMGMEIEMAMEMEMGWRWR